MKRRVMAGINRLMIWLIALLLLTGVAAAPAYAEDPEILPLNPGEKTSEDGLVTLHKWGERTGPTEWTVHVKVNIGETAIQKRKMEVVFLLDISKSMRDHTAHDHTDECSKLLCHEHNDDCYAKTCGVESDHTHSELDGDCYERTCTNHHHEHIAIGETNSCYTKCTRRENPNHYNNRNQHKNNTSCTSYNGSYYYLDCDGLDDLDEDCYTLVCEEHAHTDDCYTLTCKIQVHEEHTLGCYYCPYYASKLNPDQDNENEYLFNGDATRMAVAVVAAERLIASLPKDVTTVTRLAFDRNFHTLSKDQTYFDILTGSGTYMWTAINTTLTSSDYFKDKNAEKVFVVLTDGEANTEDVNASRDAALNTHLPAFKNDKGGTVFAIGFDTGSSTNDYLEQVASTPDHFKYANNAESLNLAFEQIEKELTAMLIDPMGTAVGFTQNSIIKTNVAGGDVTWSDGNETIYWNPAEGGNGAVAAKSTIQYSYTVNLNTETNEEEGIEEDDLADMTVGTHHNVELNNKTTFLYGTTDGEMKEEDFLIPRATYKLSSIQTSWVDEDGNAIPVTGYSDTITDGPMICDYPPEPPEFGEEFTAITEKILTTDGTGDYYVRVGSEVSAVQSTTWHDANETNGSDTEKTETVSSVNGLEDVNPANPYHYTVVHKYRRINADTLVLTATKELVGRSFTTDDEFEFVLTPVTANAPMPKDDDGNTISPATVTIQPTSGASCTFVFPDIVYSAEGTYEYTVHEKTGELDDMIYDPTVHKVIVNVTKNTSGNYVATATLDGPLVFTNRLVPGNLKVEKIEVKSYNEAHQDQEFQFTIEVKVEGRPLTGTYTATKTAKDGSTTEISVTFGSAGTTSVTLKAGESVEIEGIPKDATYTVTEQAVAGFVATVTEQTSDGPVTTVKNSTDGTIVADETVTASFKNEYQAKGQYQFRATKTLLDADGETVALAQSQFSFQVLDENGNVVAYIKSDGTTDYVDGTNNTDGSIFFDTMTFTQGDIGEDGKGEKKFKIVEVAGDDASILYDGTVYEVTLTIVDKGDGTLTVTDNLPVTDSKKQWPAFTNRQIPNQLVVSKTVTGDLGSRNRVFTFTLTLSDKAGDTVNVSTDGVNFTETTLDANGQMTFTLKHGESISIYPVNGYTVTETDYGSYKVSYSLNGADPVVAATVTDAADENGDHVAFINNLTAPVPTGVSTPAASALIGICLAAGLIAIALAGRRCVCYES